MIKNSRQHVYEGVFLEAHRPWELPCLPADGPAELLAMAEWAEEREGVAEVTTRDRGHLTRTERRLLEHLVRDGGRIVSHRELLEAMSIEDIGTLHRCILRLRKKIEIDPALPRVIITHHRQGYSFAGKGAARWFPELEP